MTFGFATLTDALCWAVVALLGVKLLATALLLARRNRPHAEAWWLATKLTPAVAVPLLIVIAVRAHDRQMLTLWCAMMVFVAVAVPWKVRRRYVARA